MPTRVSASRPCESGRARALRSVLLLAALLAPTLHARAQLSRPQPQWKDARCARLSHAQAVFVGRATRFERVTLKVNWGLGGGEETLRLVHFAVEERFKWVEGNEVGVLTQPPEAPVRRTCAGDFRAGSRYLVYAYSWARQPDLRTDFCHSVVPIEEAGDDLAYLRAFAKGEPVAEVAGKVEQYRREYAASRLHHVRALEGVEVTAEAHGRSLKTKTDAAGRYHFTGLAPATYTLRLGVPEGLYTAAPDLPAYAAESACHQTDFWLEADGRVSGRVTDLEGRPVSGAPLEMVPADAFPADESKINEEVLRGAAAATDADGRFEFRGVPGGRYLLGVNLRGAAGGAPVEWNPPTIFPRTYYPGTPARAEAGVIELREGGSVSGLSFKLARPPERALVRREIRVEVVLSDGRPAPCAMVSLLDAKHAPRRGMLVFGPSEIRVGEDGRFTFHGYEGYNYAVQAYVPVLDARGHRVGSVVADPAFVSPTATTVPLRIVVPPGGDCDFMTRPKP